MAEGQPDTEVITWWMTIAVLAMTALAILVIIVFRLAIKKVMQEKEKIRQAEFEHQQKLLYTSIAIQERERKRIAADIHDELSSRLNVVKLNIYEVRKSFPDWANRTDELLDKVIDISRNISHDLYPPLLLELGLPETIRDYLTPFERQMKIELNIVGETNLLSKEQELQLFRVFQEQLQNVIKHAQANKLSIDLKYTHKYCLLKIADNGVGYEPESVKSGLGLINLESRVQLLKGQYKLKSSFGKGTTLIIYIPHKA